MVKGKKPFSQRMKKIGRNVKKAFINRYGTLKAPNLANIVSDVAFLKGIINAEKKRYNIVNSGAVAIGQVVGNASGHVCFDITPTPSQSNTISGRSGSSLKLTTAFMKFQFNQLANANHPARLKIHIIQVLGSPQLVANIPNQFYQGNKWIATNNAGSPQIYDFASERNPDYYGQYKVLRTKTFTIQPDSLSGQTMLKDIQMKMKFNKGKGHHIRYNADTNTVANGQIVCLITCDSGNASASTSSTLAGVQIQGTNTAYGLNYDMVHYYFDN